MARLVLSGAVGLLAGIVAVAAFFAMLYLYAFRAPDHPGFVVIGVPLGYAVGAVTCALSLAHNGHDLSVWNVLMAVLFGLMAAVAAVLIAASILAFTALLRPPYMAGLLFILTAVAVTRYLATRPA